MGPRSGVPDSLLMPMRLPAQVNGNRIPLTDNRIIEEVSCLWTKGRVEITCP